MDWRTSLRGSEDPYLVAKVVGPGSAKHFLAQLREIPRENARAVFRQVCVSAHKESR